nr:oleate hydratase [Rhizobium leguminosarum]
MRKQVCDIPEGGEEAFKEAFKERARRLRVRLARYMLPFVHHIGTLANLSSLRFTRYNQYQSLIRPLVSWLEGKGVHFRYDTQVENIEVETSTAASWPGGWS